MVMMRRKAASRSLQVSAAKLATCARQERGLACWHSHAEAGMRPLIPAASTKRGCTSKRRQAASPPRTGQGHCRAHQRGRRGRWSVLLRWTGPSQQHWDWVVLGGRAPSGLPRCAPKALEQDWARQTPPPVPACR